MSLSKYYVGAFATLCLFLGACAQEKNDKPAIEKTVKKSPVATQAKEKLSEKALIDAKRTLADANQKIELIAVSGQNALAPTSPSRMAVLSAPQSMYHPQPTPKQHLFSANKEQYPHQEENSTKLVTQFPVSTFSIDVDTASYSNVRRLLNQGHLPHVDAVRVEELINYFSYDYPKQSRHPDNKNRPFSTYTEVAPSPFNEGKHLVHIGIMGETVQQSDRPASNLVFLVDVSGSMNSENKIGLLKHSLKMLTKQLSAQDSVAIVVYAGAAGTVLKPTSGSNAQAINEALDRLTAGGSTNGGEGIQAAYQLAEQSFIKGGINRILLATDGDFNIGSVSQEALKSLVKAKRKTGITLSVLGFGSGNYNDATMQSLAQNGNGNAYYIDNLSEARKVLVEELSSTLMVIAKDVKIQVEFNPNIVSEYRLVGYESRVLKREDFNNDKVDAGEIGAGHSVTALYEVSFVESKNKLFDNLRYQTKDTPANSSMHAREISEKNKQQAKEIAYLRLRYKQPEQENSQLMSQPILLSQVSDDFQSTSDSFRFAAAVAGFGQFLKGGKYLDKTTLEDLATLAQAAKGSDNYGYRAEFINLVKLASALQPNPVVQSTQ